MTPRATDVRRPYRELFDDGASPDGQLPVDPPVEVSRDSAPVRIQCDGIYRPERLQIPSSDAFSYQDVSLYLERVATIGRSGSLLPSQAERVTTVGAPAPHSPSRCDRYEFGG